MSFYHILIVLFTSLILCNYFPRYFTYLSVHGDKTRYNIALASIEANQCQDLLSQAQYHVSRARRIDEEERNLRTKQEQERAAFRKRQEEERLLETERRRKADEEMLAKREEFKEKTKNALLFAEAPPDRRKAGRGRRDEYVSDSGSGANENREEGGEKPRKKTTKGKKRGEKRGRREKRDRSDGDSDGPREKRSKKKGKSTKSKPSKEGLTQKQKMRVVSKATISTSESDSDNKLEIASDKNRSRSASAGSNRSSRSRSSGEFFFLEMIWSLYNIIDSFYSFIQVHDLHHEALVAVREVEVAADPVEVEVVSDFSCLD